MLQFDGVSVRQGAFTLTADLTLQSGQVTAVMGPSGAGKSTLLALAAGFLAPHFGRIVMDGTDVTTLPADKRPMSVLFQDSNLFPHLTVELNVALGLAPSARLTPKVRGQVEEVLARVGLVDMGSRRPAELSGGQQSRAALARVLLRRRPLVLLDEPFSALGPGLRGEMLDFVAEVLSDATVLMVTHAPADAERIARDVIFVEDGFAHAPRATKDILANPPAALQTYLG
ncbi:MAG: ATP-binding cassette domain-containing protein [Pseudomonadota bacterium]